MTERTMLARQASIVPMDILDTPITVVGAGAVGSFTALALAKVGFTQLHVYDNDEVSEVNLGNQFYRFSDIGKPKVAALAEIVEAFSGTRIAAFPMRYPSDIALRTPVVILAVDSMASRSEIYHATKDKIGSRWLIDPRMGGEHASLKAIRTMSREDQVWYEKTLYRDDEVANEPCTAKATCYTAIMLAGLVTQTVKDCLASTPKRDVVWSIKDCVLEAE